MNSTKQGGFDVGGAMLDEDIPVQPLSDIADNIEKATWLVNGLIPEGEITLVGGARGAMKTYFAWGLGTCVALGESEGFIGRESQRRQVVYIDRENPLGVIKDRANKIGCPEGVFMWSSNYTPNQPPPTLDKKEGLAMYLRIIEKYGPSPLIVFDTLSKMTSVDMNDGLAMKGVMGRFRTLANAGATILILHHMSIAKQGEKMTKSKNSAVIEEDSDTVYHIHKGKEQGRITLTCPKNRLEFVPDLKLRLTGNSHYMFWSDITGKEIEVEH